MSDAECVELVVEFGYAGAAERMGVSTSALWERISRAGRLREVQTLRGRVSGASVAAATLDHIHPLALGGSHTYDNVKAAHYGCNSQRGDRAEFQMRLPVAA